MEMFAVDPVVPLYGDVAEGQAIATMRLSARAKVCLVRHLGEVLGSGAPFYCT